MKTTKSGCQIKFTASKTGLIGTTLNVYGNCQVKFAGSKTGMVGSTTLVYGF